ncbi:hypothetical protein Tsubulata_048473 [Turnera subulata]|uniref:Uncharacterized protein n=1 Tax=Turnera subulata TaxID=218843 RepID=A0A9Q0JRK5_9ROSI|nr:hypothetical protein Tsubulata_048473 [Turnera subulata]
MDTREVPGRCSFLLDRARINSRKQKAGFGESSLTREVPGRCSFLLDRARINSRKQKAGFGESSLTRKVPGRCSFLLDRARINSRKQKAGFGESSLEQEKWHSPLEKVISELAIKVREDGEDAKWGDLVESIKGVILQIPGSDDLKIRLEGLVEEFLSPLPRDKYFKTLSELLISLERELIQEEILSLGEAIKSTSLEF